MIITRSKKAILESIQERTGYEDYTEDDIEGWQIERSDNGKDMITRPAPEGEPRHYHARTNTGRRRFVDWA